MSNHKSKDKNRDEAIMWCLDNSVDFCNPEFPPPDGWMWGDNNDHPAKSLIPIFTNEHSEDIDEVDVVIFFASGAYSAAKTQPAKGEE